MRAHYFVVLLLLLMPTQGIAQNGDAKFIKRDNASRLPVEEPEGLTINLENQITTTLTLPEVKLKSCQARLAIRYQQRNTLVRVNGEFSNDNCAQSAGTVDLVLSYRNASNEQNTLHFTEQWQHGPSFEEGAMWEYEIGTQATLSRVQARNVRCSCKDTDIAE